MGLVCRTLSFIQLLRRERYFAPILKARNIFSPEPLFIVESLVLSIQRLASLVAVPLHLDPLLALDFSDSS